VQKQLQGLHGRSLQSQVLQLQQQVEGGEEAAAKWAETHDALQLVHAKLQHERERVIELQNEKVCPPSHLLAEPITRMLLLTIVAWRKTFCFGVYWGAIWRFVVYSWYCIFEGSLTWESGKGQYGGSNGKANEGDHVDMFASAT
jgi:hypothetical protein